MNPFRPISAFLSPNTEKDDVKLALKTLFEVWQWQRGKGIENLEREFKNYFRVKYASSFNGGRSSLLAILKAMRIKKRDEVLLQAFTCSAAVNPILWQGAEPVFVDIDETLNLNPEDLMKKVTLNSRAVIIQHTFGWPAKIDEIKEICKKNNLFLIEDCAHALGARYKGKLIGKFGDAAFFSFGRDKMISSVYGGMAITNNDKIGQNLKEIQRNLPFPSASWIFQQILHPISFAIFLPIYSFLNLGKGILYLKQKLKILSPSVYQKEKRGQKPVYFPKRTPNALAILALNQFKKLERFNKHRRKIVKFYRDNLREINFALPDKDEQRKPVFMRFPILMEGSKKILNEAKKQNILFDDGWRDLPVVPRGTDLKMMHYKKGSCPRAEKVAKEILNLPTSINIRKREAQKIINVVSKFTK